MPQLIIGVEWLRRNHLVTITSIRSSHASSVVGSFQRSAKKGVTGCRDVLGQDGLPFRLAPRAGGLRAGKLGHSTHHQSTGIPFSTLPCLAMLPFLLPHAPVEECEDVDE